MKINVSLTDLNLDAQQNVKQGLTINTLIEKKIRRKLEITLPLHTKKKISL